MNTPVAMLLSRKGPAVYSVAPSASVSEAVRIMNENRIGSVLVMVNRRVVGIFTERDVLTRVVATGRNPNVVRIDDVMTANLQMITPDATIEEAMEVFAQHRCRHLPVIANGGALLGMLSIGDISRWMLESHRSEAEHLRRYIAGTFTN